MRLTSDPKPVRFRIMSGGEEHSSLDSLKLCFSVLDLQKIKKQLILWLNRQGTEGALIAHGLKEFLPDPNIEIMTENIFLVYRVFFQKEIEGNQITNLCQLLEYWYGKRGYSNNVHYLIELGFGKDDDVTLFCYRHKISGLTDDWIAILKNINRPEIPDLISQEEKLLNRPKRFRDIDPELMKKRMFFYWEFGSFMDDTSLYSEKEMDILTFTNDCRKIVKYELVFDDALSIFSFNLKEIFTEQKFHEIRGKDLFFDAKFFVLLILFKAGFSRILSEEEYENFELCKNESMKVYLPTKYFLIGYEHIESFDNEGFKYKNKYEQIKLFVLNHLFEFGNE